MFWSPEGFNHMSDNNEQAAIDQAIKQILREQRLAPKKRLGQNFLVHRHTAQRLVDIAGVEPTDVILEIGCGLGALTRPLARQAQGVIGLEIDAGVSRWLKEKGGLPDNVTLLHQDVMKADFQELAKRCAGPLKIMANLPYSISNPLLFKLIENQETMAWAVLMLQKEVGQRLTAQPGTGEYGVLSVLLGACATVTRLLDLGPGNFHPRPKVDSVVVRIVFQPVPARIKALPPYNRPLLHQLVKAAFQQRRKTLLNALAAAPWLDMTKAAIAQLLEQTGLPPEIRGERLTVEDFIRLTRAFAASGKG